MKLRILQNRFKICMFLTLALVFQSCKDDSSKDTSKEEVAISENQPLFTSLPKEQTNVNYVNKLPAATPSMNYFSYPNIYNGGGVSLGDINNDGLVDIYFTSNFGHNKLYVNKGNLTFQEMSKSANVEGAWGWSTGTSMIDINNDGYLDIYVCRSGNVPSEKRQNELFINNGNLTFTESAKEYGLAIDSYAIQSVFLDYDKDGDLDMYLLNNPKVILVGESFEEEKKQRNPLTTDKFFRNDNGKFVEVSEAVGLVNNGIGFGHSASVGDYNNDGWPDIYVSNDYTEHDYLYYNNGDGTFSEKLKESMRHISNFSMGTDVADINNDGLMDLMVLDMVAEDNYRIKTNMSGMSTEAFYNTVKSGFHYQYMTNTVQLNNGNGTFSDVSKLTGLSSTDWSWSALWADFDNDGMQDLFVTNGYRKDVRNNDYSKVKDSILKEMSKSPTGSYKYIQEILAIMPEVPIKNYFFKNEGDLNFTKKQEEWGVTEPSFSNGASYADLDNDGDLDLVINNIDQPATILRNNAEKLKTKNYLKIKLKGQDLNTSGIGSRIVIKTGADFQVKEHYLSKGYISSLDDKLHFGLGNHKKIDSLWVSWPDGNTQLLTNVKGNQQIEIAYRKENPPLASLYKKSKQPLMEEVTNAIAIGYTHKENEYNDFENEILIPHKMSTMGPGMAVADVNGDGLEDFYVGGAKGYTGVLYTQNKNGSFTTTKKTPWNKDIQAEDIAATFIDVDNDNDMDLYVVSGGNEVAPNSPLLQDRIYLNDGKGNFEKATNALPEMLTSGGVVSAADFDADGDMDLFVGGRVIPGQYPKAPRSYLLQNNGGIFTDVTKEIAPDLVSPGLITTALWTDINKDGAKDLMVAGEWTAISVFQNTNNTFKNVTGELGLQDSQGWWYGLAAGDFDGDGDEDYVVGNLGQNYKYQASPETSFDLFYDDFDGNNTGDIVLSYEEDGKKVPLRGRECSSQQMPFIKEKFGTYDAFAKAELKDIFGEEKLKKALHLQAKTFASVYLQNNGKEGWKMVSLPRIAQISSVNDFIVKDFNKDGNLDVVLAGNLYGSEVETPRNDAGNGLVLFGDGKGKFIPQSIEASGFFAPRDVKGLQQIMVADKLHIAVVNNSDKLQFFRVN